MIYVLYALLFRVQNVWYCGKACQKVHWKVHKKLCKAGKKAKKTKKQKSKDKDKDKDKVKSIKMKKGAGGGGGYIFSNVPAKAPNFLGRKAEFQASIFILDKQKNNGTGNTVVISGFGGNGKSLLATEIAHQLAPSYGFVVFLNCSSTSALFASFHHCLSVDLGIDTDKIAAKDVPHAFWGFMARQDKKMLALLDNCDDASFLKPFLPSPQHRKTVDIIITSRLTYEALAASDLGFFIFTTCIFFN